MAVAEAGAGATRPPGAPAGLAGALGETFNPMEALGGVRGMVESTLPVVLFSIVYAVTQELKPSVGAALVVSVAGLLLRIGTRRPVMPALSGLLGLGLGAGLALRSGRDQDVFLPTIVKNVAFLVLYAGSVLVRWPLVGVFLGLILGEQTHWRAVPARRRAYGIVTWIWVGMFAVRLAVEVPLYASGHTGALAAATIPLGLPLYGLVLLLTWLVVRQVPTARPHADDEPGDPAIDAPGEPGADGSSTAPGEAADRLPTGPAPVAAPSPKRPNPDVSGAGRG